MTTHVLAFHALYRCRHAGVCCTSGWTIPVEAPLHRSLRVALEWGQLRPDGPHKASDLFEEVSGLPNAEPVVLRKRADGACVFFERERGNLCGIQRQVAHTQLPSACRHFPRVAVIDPRGTFVTLSHVCPTAARLLLEDADARVVTSGPVIDRHLDLEGLDARDALPPLINPDLLWDWEGWDRWERGASALLATADGSPEMRLGALRRAVAAVRRWRPAAGALEDAVIDALATASAAAEPLMLSPLQMASLLTAVESSIPEALKPSGLRLTPSDDMRPCRAWDGPTGRYLAARAFANWVGYYGTSLETWFRSILAAYVVLVVSAAARVDAGASETDALLGAFGDADRLMLHLAAAPELAAALDEWEE